MDATEIERLREWLKAGVAMCKDNDAAAGKISIYGPLVLDALFDSDCHYMALQHDFDPTCGCGQCAEHRGRLAALDALASRLASAEAREAEAIELLRYATFDNYEWTMRTGKGLPIGLSSRRNALIATKEPT